MDPHTQESIDIVSDPRPDRARELSAEPQIHIDLSRPHVYLPDENGQYCECGMDERHGRHQGRTA